MAQLRMPRRRIVAAFFFFFSIFSLFFSLLLRLRTIVLDRRKSGEICGEIAGVDAVASGGERKRGVERREREREDVGF